VSWVKNNEWLTPRTDNSIHWSRLGKFLRHYRPFRGRLAFAALLALIGSATAFLIPLIFGKMQSSLVTGDLRLLGLMVAAYLGVLVFQAAITYLISLSRARVSTQLNEDLVLQYYRKLLNISVEDFIEFKQKSNLFQRVIDAMAVTNDFTEVVIQGVQSIIFIIVMMIVIGTISPIVLTIVTTGGALLFIFVYWYGDKLREKRQTFLAINYPLVGNMLEAIQGLFTIKALAASIRITSDIGDLVRKRRDAERDELVIQTRVTQGSQAIISCTLALALGASFILLIQGKLDYSDTFALYVLVSALLVPVAELARLYKNLSSLSINVKNYYQVLDIPDESTEAAQPASKPLPVAISSRKARAASVSRSESTPELAYVQMQDSVTAESVSRSAVSACARAPVGVELDAETNCGHLVFRDVDFAYRGGEPVFQGLSLEIYPGEKISLIGRSGAGKTTLLRLLMGFLVPQRGTILVDGVDISTIADKNSFRKLFGLVSQQDFFFGTTIQENLLFGLEEQRSEAEIGEALRLVNLRDCVESLPQKLHTVYSEDMFSGGQKQRFFIVRALLRRPRVVLLDEPTSALDFENEAQMINAIDLLAHNRTTITIAHRLSTVRTSDRLLVLNDRRIVASGTHEELYASNDYYRAFCDYNSFIL